MKTVGKLFPENSEKSKTDSKETTPKDETETKNKKEKPE